MERTIVISDKGIGPKYTNCFVITLDLCDDHAWVGEIAYPKIKCSSSNDLLKWYEVLVSLKRSKFSYDNMPEPFKEVDNYWFTIPDVDDESYVEISYNDMAATFYGIDQIRWYDENGFEYPVEIK